MLKLIATFVLILLISACTGNTTKDDLVCTNNDWSAIGYSTATKGLSVRTFDKYKEQCGKLPETALTTYLDGFTKGVTEYCTYDNGFLLGSKNVNKPESCPLELRAEFMRGYNQGLIILKDQIKRMERDADANQGKSQRTIDSGRRE